MLGPSAANFHSEVREYVISSDRLSVSSLASSFDALQEDWSSMAQQEAKRKGLTQTNN